MSVFPSLEEPGQNWRKKAVGKKQLGESPERKAGKETNICWEETEKGVKGIGSVEEGEGFSTPFPQLLSTPPSAGPGIEWELSKYLLKG